MAIHRLAIDEARRIAIGAQMLDANRPQTLLEVVERLTFLQIDPTAASRRAPTSWRGRASARPMTPRI